jgi:hypothetical protein
MKTQIKRALVFTKKTSTLVTKGRALLQLEKKGRRISIDFLIRFHGNYKNLNFEFHIIHNVFPGKTFERKCKESGKGKHNFDIIFFNFVS